MAKTPTDVCAEIEDCGRQIGEKAFYTFASRLLCEIAANTGVAAAADSEILCLCDETSPDVFVPFIRIITIDAGVPSKADFELDGTTPYVVSDEANVDKCGAGVEGSGDSEILCLCDETSPDVFVPFLRVITINAGVPSKADFELDGTTPYVVSDEANVSKCASDSFQAVSEQVCVEFGQELGFQVLDGSGNSGTTHVRQRNILTDAIIDVDYLSAGANGTFVDLTTNLDGSRVYMLLGNPRSLEVIDWPGQVRVGAITLVTGLTVGHVPYSLAIHPITGVVWMLAKVNGTSALHFYTLNTATAVATFVGSGNFGQFTHTPEPGMQFDVQGNLFVGGRNAVTVRDEIRRFDPNSFVDLGLILSFPSSPFEERTGLFMITPRNTFIINGAVVTKEYSASGVKLDTYPGFLNGADLELYPSVGAGFQVSDGALLTKISIIDSMGNIVTTKYFDQNGNEIDVTGLTLGLCCCESSFEYDYISSQILAVPAATAVTLSVPLAAEGAFIQVDQTAGALPLRYRTDGTAAAAATGKKASDGSVILVGNTPNSWKGDPVALLNFSAFAEAANTFNLYIDYFKRV